MSLPAHRTRAEVRERKLMSASKDDTADEVLYVLPLEHGHYYVGKTNNMRRRLAEHLEGKGAGARWTMMHKPLPEAEPVLRPFHAGGWFQEDNLTKEYMVKYGIDKVRGGSYCRAVLSGAEKHMLRKEFNHDDDRCTSCGSHVHFRNECPMQSTQNTQNAEAWSSSSLKRRKSDHLNPNWPPVLTQSKNIDDWSSAGGDADDADADDLRRRQGRKKESRAGCKWTLVAGLLRDLEAADDALDTAAVVQVLSVAPMEDDATGKKRVLKVTDGECYVEARLVFATREELVVGRLVRFTKFTFLRKGVVTVTACELGPAVGVDVE